MLKDGSNLMVSTWPKPSHWQVLTHKSHTAFNLLTVGYLVLSLHSKTRLMLGHRPIGKPECNAMRLWRPYDPTASIVKIYLRPLRGSGTRSTTVVAGRWRASLTGINSPVFASRPRKDVSGAFGDCFLIMIKYL